MNILQAALDYIERGYAPTPIRPKSKAAIIEEWQEFKITAANAHEHFSDEKDGNIGIVLGELSDGLIDLDLDCPEAIALAPHFLLPTASRFGRTSAPGSHWLYVVNPAPKTRQFSEPFDKAIHTDKGDLMLVEMRGTGGQTVFPPSTHESGEPIRFEEDGKPAVVTAEELTRAASHLAAASLLVRYFPSKGIRHTWALALAGGLLRSGWTEEEATNFMHAVLVVAKSENPNLHLAVVRDTAKKLDLATDDPLVTGWPTLSEILGARVVKAVRKWLGSSSDLSVGGLRMTDVENGERFAQQHQDAARYCYAWKKWLVWDGQRWKVDDGGRVMTLAKQTARSLDALVVQEKDDTKRKRLRQWATECERKHRLENMLFLAQSEAGMAIAADELDADPWLFNVANGTLDLRTGELREHRREDFITKSAPVAYRPEAVAPMLERLLNRLFEKRVEVRDYLQRIFGYALTGRTQEQCFFIFFGTGSNGKSTILRAILDLLGDYGETTRPETFLVKRNDGGIPNDVAALVGVRFVSCLESEQGKQLAEGLVKGMTGGDKVSARKLHQEYFSFAPQFKLFIGTNHKPTIKGTDHAMWRRVRCVPFSVVIPDAEQDKDLSDKLRAEGSGILNWLVQGCLTWRRDGLGPPLEVTEATESYRQEQDTLGAFLEEKCLVDPKATCTKNEIYADYKRWCETSGVRYPLDMRKFGQALRERGFTDTRLGDGTKGWEGIKVKF